jgi:hypothetical protein
MDDRFAHAFSLSTSVNLEILSPSWDLKIRYIVSNSPLLVLNMSQINLFHFF